ncbi:phage holin family protein [Yaniella flava]|uniref:Phage holin family protein n=1 Tax=Yaniella flava TaxID=287930 RepID=A0ABP5GLF9_9MICC
MSYLLRTIVTAASFWVAAWILPGMSLTADTGTPDTGESIIALLLVSVVFGLINGVIRPIVSLLSLPITCLTLGLFTLVINAAMLSLTVWVTSFLPVHVTIDSFFWTTILAALIIALVSTIGNRLIASVAPIND